MPDPIIDSRTAEDGETSITLDYSGAHPTRGAIERVSLRFDDDAGSGSTETVVFTDGSTTQFQIAGFENFTVTGSSGNDSVRMLQGRTLNFQGLEGNDAIGGGSASDVLDGGAGDDRFTSTYIGSTVIGGAGYDEIVLASATSSIGTDITIDLTAGGLIGENWREVEAISGTLGQGNDSVVGNALITSLNGNIGTDSITLDYSGAHPTRGAIERVSLRFDDDAGSGSTETVVFTDGSTTQFQIAGFENFTVTGSSGNDSVRMLQGRTLNFQGLEGNDAIGGGSASDVLDGGAGDDRFTSTYIGSTVIGGAGYDEIVLASATSSIGTDITIDLTAGGLIGENWREVEAISGTLGQGNDSVVGNALITSLNGNIGTDSITLDYSGAHPTRGAIERVSLRFDDDAGSGSTETVVFTDGSTTQFQIAGFENFTVTGSSGNDSVRMLQGRTLNFQGLEGNDAIGGGSASDVLDGGAGDDRFTSTYIGSTVIGGAGYDEIVLASATSSIGTDITIDLTAGGLIGENWREVEAISGTLGQGNDSVVGNALITSLNGNIGTDSITLDYSGAHPTRGAIERVSLRFDDDAGSGSTETVVFTDGSTTQFQIAGFENFTVTGSSGNDSVRMLQGRTLNFQGLEGNDVVNAIGSPSAVAYFLGDESDYSISISEDGNTTTVTDLNLANGNEGTDTLIGVTDLVFGTRLNPNDPPQTSGDTNQEFTDLDAIPLSDLFDLSDPEGLGDIVSLEISDDTPGTDGGLFQSTPPFGAPFTVPRPASGPYRLDITPAELEFWSYQPGTFGTNAIQIEATDSEGNVSDPLVINLTFIDPDAPTGSAPEISVGSAQTLLIAGSDGNTALNFDSSVVDVSDTDGDLFTITYTLIDSGGGGFLRLDGDAPDEDGVIPVGPAGLDRVTYEAGPNAGTAEILVTAVDQENNTSFETITIDVVLPIPENVGPSIVEPAPIIVQADVNGVFFDLVATDGDGKDTEGEGGGLAFSRTPSPDQLNFNVNPNTGEIAFIREIDGGLPDDSDGNGIHELTVRVTDSDGLFDEIDLQIQVEPEASLESASLAELEYFARQSAYGYGPYLAELGDGVNASQSASEIEEFLDGWEVVGEFPPPGASSTFRAIILEKPGYYPVVAFRGTQTTLQDWAENFRNSGVGEDEFQANVFSSGLRDWIDTNPIFSVTGHSQGGAQAQLFAILAGLPEVGATVQNLTTFNSSGIPTLSSGGSTRLPEQVDHFVNASDVVSLVGDTFLDGTLHYSDFTDDEPNPLKVGLTAHTGYWMQEPLRNIDFYQNKIEFISASQLPVSSPVSTPPLLEQFIDPDFDPFGNYGQDSELSSLVWSLVGVLTAYEFSEGEFILGLPRADLSSVLSGIDAGQLRNDLILHHQSRSGWEYLRENWGPEVSSRIDRLPDILEGFEVATGALVQLGRDTVEIWLATGEFSIDVGVSLGNAVLSGTALAGRSVVGLGNFVIDSTQGALVQTFLSASEVAEWIGERFQPEAPLPFVGGTHSESTAAIAGNFNQNTGETLSSSGSGSIFIVTDPNSTIQMETGDNLIWGLATDYDGLVIEGGVGNTDLLFIQDEFFDTNDLNIFRGSAVIEVDLDQDGSADISVTWEGDYRLDSIVAEQAEDGTYIRYLGNTLPEATDDEFATSESTSFTTGDVLFNDTDEDGDVLSVTGLDLAGTLGSVVDNGDGTFDYDPNGAFDDLLDGETASDTFAYFVSDGVETVRGEVKITIDGESQLEPKTVETIDIDLIKQGFFGRTVASITVTNGEGGIQTDMQGLGWFSRKITLDEAGIKITSGGPGFDTVSAINGGLGVSSRADGFVFRDRLDTDRRESLKFSLQEEEEIATRLLLDFADEAGDVRLVFFNDGERVSRDTYSYQEGMLELADLAFDQVRISGAGNDDVRVTGIEFDRLEDNHPFIDGVDSFEFV